MLRCAWQTVQKSTSYNLNAVVAPNSRRKARWSPNDRDGISCADSGRQPRLLEHSRGQPALCMTSDRSVGVVWHEVLGHVQVQVVDLVHLVGSPSCCGRLGDSLLPGDATWALPDCAAIFGMGAGMRHREVGSLGAKGCRQDFKACLRTWTNTGQVMRLCSNACGHGAVRPQADPFVSTEAINLWGTAASLMRPWCAKGGANGSEPEPVRWGRIIGPMASR